MLITSQASNMDVIGGEGVDELDTACLRSVKSDLLADEYAMPSLTSPGCLLDELSGSAEYI